MQMRKEKGLKKLRGMHEEGRGRKRVTGYSKEMQAFS